MPANITEFAYVKKQDSNKHFFVGPDRLYI